MAKPLSIVKDEIHEATGDPNRNAPESPVSDLCVPTLHDAAYHGLAGEFVRALDPHTEADPVAVLIHVLVLFGVACGRGPHLTIDGSRHGTNEFAVTVGASSKARKGTADARAKETFLHADPEFMTRRVKGGLSSGEGLIYQVRDPVETLDLKTGQMVATDPGEGDKRLLAVEQEFGGVLKVIERDGNTLSALLRMAWDGSKLSPLTKGNRIEATDPHIGMIGHITQAELLRRFTDTEAANGFGNRILWIYTRRSKLLPEGGAFREQAIFGERFRAALVQAKTIGTLTRSESFRAAWSQVYPSLTAGEQGLTGHLTNRQEAHALRLAMIYALLDQSETIDLPHLKAALAITDYIRETVEWIFGKKTGDPTADRILEYLKIEPKTQTDIYLFFGKHESSAEIERALKILVDSGRVKSHSEKTPGRPRILWSLNT
jgi:hypothetical protein